MIGFGAWFLQTLDTSAGRGGAADSASAARTGAPVFTDESLPEDVDALLAAAPAPPEEGLRSTEDAPLSGSAPPTVADACALRGTGRPDESPIAADKGRYEGAPSTLVVLPDASDPARVDAYVVRDGSCELLAHRSLPRR